MPAYHQMGFHSNNLIDLPEMSDYKGAIFSPINVEQESMSPQIEAALQSRGRSFDIIFDPQLYVPATNRGKLKDWSYFPQDVDTADYSSSRWWSSITGKLAQAITPLNLGAVCSPVVIPKVFNDSYYSQTVAVAGDLRKKIKVPGIRTLQTVLVSSADLTSAERAFEIGSIVTKTECESAYVVLVTNIEPRRELLAPDEVVGFMRFINLIATSGLKVLVGFCSSDVLLWKVAGATDCASGKFFNLRRFTRQRFEEPEGAGGGQLPYWFEESLLAFLREQDLLLIQKQRLLSDASERNPFGHVILSKLDEAKKSGKKQTWLADSWRHFLYWFADVERRLCSGETNARNLLETADRNWAALEKAKILLIERPNDGSWIRTWLNALNDFENA